MRALQSHLASLEIKPPASLAGKRHGGQGGFSMEQLRRVLTNPANLGHIAWFTSPGAMCSLRVPLRRS